MAQCLSHFIRSALTSLSERQAVSVFTMFSHGLASKPVKMLGIVYLSRKRRPRLASARWRVSGSHRAKTNFIPSLPTLLANTFRIFPIATRQILRGWRTQRSSMCFSWLLRGCLACGKPAHNGLPMSFRVVLLIYSGAKRRCFTCVV